MIVTLPDALIPAIIDRGRIAPTFLGAADLPWLAALLDQFRRFHDRPERELKDNLQLPLPCSAPPFKLRAATAYLERRWSTTISSALKPTVARETLFLASASAGRGVNRRAVAIEVAERLNISVVELEQALIADLPGERIVRPPKQEPTPTEIVSEINQTIVRSLLARANTVDVCAQGSVRGVVRQAKLTGLLCTVRHADPTPVLSVSGPFSLFKHTLLYGRALGSLLGRLPYCGRWSLNALCRLRGREGTLTLSSDDAVFQLQPGTTPRSFDSKLEERFARDMARAAPDWDLIREPEAIVVGSSLMFPDFAMVHRVDRTRRFLIEIVGFWTTDYLLKKLAGLRAAGRDDLIVCIDESLQCDDAALPASSTIVRFKRRIRPEQILTSLSQVPSYGRTRRL